MVSSVPSRLGEHPGEATLLHGKAVKARSTTSKIHTSGLWIDKLANQELLSQEECMHGHVDHRYVAALITQAHTNDHIDQPAVAVSDGSNLGGKR